MKRERITEPRAPRLLYQEALDVQDASNFVAVVRAMARSLDELRANYTGQEKAGGDFRDHPIMILWVSKLISMTNADDALVAAHAFSTAHDVTHPVTEADVIQRLADAARGDRELLKTDPDNRNLQATYRINLQTLRSKGHGATADAIERGE